MNRDEVTSLNQSLEAVLRSLKGPSAQSMSGLFGVWDDVVGAHIAAHSRPILFDRGKLVIEVDQPGWATQLRYLEADLLERLRPHAGSSPLTGIEVRVARPK